MDIFGHQNIRCFGYSIKTNYKHWDLSADFGKTFCDHIIPNIWPPNSHDYNPFDYYESGAVEQETKIKSPRDTIDELKESITEVFTYLKKRQSERIAGDY